MQIPRKLKKGDKIAIVSLSSGMLGENFCRYSLEIGKKRLEEMGLISVFMPNSLKGIEYLKQNPKARADDLKLAFFDNEIAGIITATGGDDTYRLLPYLMEDKEFTESVKNQPKLFTGFSDTTVNHLMFYKLGLSTFYGPCYAADLGEISNEMLPYTQKTFENFFEYNQGNCIVSSEFWYDKRTDYSKAAIGTERTAHKETKGYELLQGSGVFRGKLLGGCLESLYEMLSSERNAEKKIICDKYKIFPDNDEWKDKILFIETCEEKPAPEIFKKELSALKNRGIFNLINGILVGKPQDEVYYNEYKSVLKDVINDRNLPVVYNVNFGHCVPRCALPYGVTAMVNMNEKKIYIDG